MLFIYQRHGMARPIYRETDEADLAQPELRGQAADLPIGTVLIFDPLLETAPASPAALGARFRALHSSSLEIADLIVLRGSGRGFRSALNHDRVFRQDVRNIGKPVSALVSRLSRKHVAPQLLTVRGRAPLGLDSIIPILRSVEIVSLLRQDGAILTGSDQYHFLLPSGFHAPEFVRIADALQNLTSVCRLAEWVIPYVSAESALLADTRSLVPLLLQIQSMVLQISGRLMPIDSFDEYPSDREKFLEKVHDLSYRHPDKEIVFLISVNSSGKLLSQVDDVRASGTLGRTQAVVLCETKSEPSPSDAIVLSRVPVDLWDVSPTGECQNCGRLFPVLIHPSNFERIGNPTFEMVQLTPVQASQNREFWESVDAAKAIHLHYRAPYKGGWGGSGRHFAVYVDLQTLLEEEQFRTECLSRIRELPRPRVGLVPEHEGAQAVKDLLVQAFSDGRGESFDPGLIFILPTNVDLRQVVGELAPEDWVLVADDAIVTGATLTAWRQQIHRIAQGRGAWINVAGFVALARPRDSQEMRPVQNCYRDREGRLLLKWGARVHMPMVGEDTCPWCSEARTLNRFGSDLAGSAKEYADERLSRLRSGEMRYPLLIGTDRDGLGTRPRTVGSFFGTLSPETAFAAASCATHTLCSELRSSWDGGRVQQLDVAHFIGSYWEDIFHSGVLRTVSGLQTRSPQQDDKVALGLRQWPIRVKERGIRETIGHIAEFGWAAVSGRLPPQAVLTMLDQIGDEYAPLEMIRQLIQLNTVRRPER